MDLFESNNINITVSKSDAVVLLKSLKVTKARKKLEANHHFKKNEFELSNKKFEFVNKIDQLSHYLEYLIK